MNVIKDYCGILNEEAIRKNFTGLRVAGRDARLWLPAVHVDGRPENYITMSHASR